MNAICFASGANAGDHTAPDKLVSGTVRMREEGVLGIAVEISSARLVNERPTTHPTAIRRMTKASPGTNQFDRLAFSKDKRLGSGSPTAGAPATSGRPSGELNASTGQRNR